MSDNPPSKKDASTLTDWVIDHPERDEINELWKLAKQKIESEEASSKEFQQFIATICKRLSDVEELEQIIKTKAKIPSSTVVPSQDAEEQTVRTKSVSTDNVITRNASTSPDPLNKSFEFICLSQMMHYGEANMFERLEVMRNIHTSMDVLQENVRRTTWKYLSLMGYENDEPKVPTCKVASTSEKASENSLEQEQDACSSPKKPKL